MVEFENKSRYDISDLIKLITILRGEDGCPWDREQTHDSIRRNLLEEAYEAASAIDEGNAEDLKEELGDVLMQVMFHAGIAKDAGRFNLDDVIDVTCKKLLRRHPHVFGTAQSRTGEESLVLWENVKREEKHHDTVADSMDTVASAIPALWRAEKIQKKAAKAGFDWQDHAGALEALRSELTETENAIETGDKEKIAQELGDLLFSVVNTARFFEVDPEEALNASSAKFTRRFRRMEELAAQQGKKLTDSGDAGSDSKMTLDEMEALYQRAKSELEK